MTHLFISYSRKDSGFARKLADSLSQLGSAVWIDTSEIEAGVKWSTAVQKGLDSCQIMILVVSPDAMESPNVEDEWQYFLDNKKPIIPVMFRAARLHFQLSRLQYINFEGQPYDTAVQKVRDEIRRKENNPVVTTEVPQVTTIADATIHTQDGVLPPNTILVGRYKILGILGGGGMGTVYQARDLAFPKVKRLVAVKEMLSNSNNPMFDLNLKKIVERETNILATLNHRAIPVFFDYFDDRTRFYIVMQYVNGTDLETLISRTQSLPIDKIIEWAIELCGILKYLHNHQPDPILFRDLKPANIMIDNNGHIKLIDFGLAKQMLPDTQKHTIIGTEGYSAPEQYKGNSSPQSDIYSLGATLHHLLTRSDPRLEPPFSFDERPIQDYNPDVSPELAAIVDKALAFEKSARFQSAEDMEKALQALYVPRNISPQNPSPQQDAPPPLVRLDETDLVWQFKTEDEIRASACVSDDRVFVGSYDASLWAIDVSSGHMLWKFRTEGGLATTPVVDKELNLVYFGSEDHHFYAIDTRTGRIVWSMGAQERIRGSATLAFDHIFFGSDDGSLYALNRSNGRLLWTYDARSPIRSTPVITNELIVFGCESGEVIALDLVGTRKWAFRTRREVSATPVLDVNEGVCYIASTDNYLHAVDLFTGAPIWRFRTGGPVLSSPGLTRNLVLFGSADGNFYAVHRNTTKERWKFTTRQPIVSSPKLNDDAVYFGGMDTFVYCLDAQSGDLRWKYQTGGAITASPCIQNGIVYIGSQDMKLYALKA